MTEIHITDVKQFLQCRKQWDFTSSLRRNLEPRKPSMPFMFGRGVHYALAQYHTHGEDPREAFTTWWVAERRSVEGRMLHGIHPELEEEMAEHLELGQSILNGYRRFAEKEIAPRYSFIAPEIEFSVPIGIFTDSTIDSYSGTPGGLEVETTGNLVHLAGRIDGVVTDSDGSMWLWENKTATSIRTEHLDIDWQCSAYVWAARQLGYEVRGSIYNYLRKKAPQEPRLLKNGSLSMDKRIDTTPEKYLRAIRKYGLDPQDYRDILGHLISREMDYPFFLTHHVTRNKYQLDTFHTSLLDVARDMLNPEVPTPIYWTGNHFDCKFCRFREPCIMESLGGDASELLEARYMEAERR